MTTVITGKPSQQSFDNLQKSQDWAAKNVEYDSANTCQAFKDECLTRCNQNLPYKWQLDAAEAFLLGLDCVIIAGTSSGKSLPFVMPSMLKINSGKVLLVLSPLNALEADQVSSMWSFSQNQSYLSFFVGQEVSPYGFDCCGCEFYNIHTRFASGKPAKCVVSMILNLKRNSRNGSIKSFLPCQRWPSSTQSSRIFFAHQDTMRI